MSKQSDLVNVAQDAGTSGYVNLTGDTMTGILSMPQQPVSATYINGINGFGMAQNDNFFTKTGGTSHYVLQGITFNGTNGRFTVPTAGKYLVSMYSLHRNGVASLTVKVNGSDWIRGYSEIATGGGWDRASMLGVRNLSANDYLEVVHTASNTVDYHGGVHSQFVIQMIG